MKIYKDFHGEIPINQIGKRLREITKIERGPFKVLTGYGASKGKSESKNAVLKSLRKMKQEKLIDDYFPGEILSQLLNETSTWYKAKIKYFEMLKKDSDFGNDGVIFLFIDSK